VLLAFASRSCPTCLLSLTISCTLVILLVNLAEASARFRSASAATISFIYLSGPCASHGRYLWIFLTSVGRREVRIYLMLPILVLSKLWTEKRTRKRHQPTLACPEAINEPRTTLTDRNEFSFNGLDFISVHCHAVISCRLVDHPVWTNRQS